MESKITIKIPDNKGKILAIDLFSGEIGGLLKTVGQWQERGERRKVITTVNPEFLMLAARDEEFARSLSESDIRVVDGVALWWLLEIKRWGVKSWPGRWREGLRALGSVKRRGLVPGCELAEELVVRRVGEGGRVMLLGGWGDRAERSKQFFEQKVAGKAGKGYAIEACEGEPAISSQEVVTRINRFEPDLLVVAYGMGKQEKWLARNREKIDFGVAIGVGRSMDYWSGELARAPEGWRRWGGEWLYSLLREPGRWRRQIWLMKYWWWVMSGKIG